MTDGLVFDLEQREKDPEVLWKGLYYKVWSRYEADMIKILCQALPSHLRKDMRAMRDQVEAMVMKTGNCDDYDYEDEDDYFDDDFEETTTE